MEEKATHKQFMDISDSMANIKISKGSKPDDEGNAVGGLDSGSVLDNPSTSTDQHTNLDGGNAVGGLDSGSVLDNPSASTDQHTNLDEGNSVGGLDSCSVLDNPSTSTEQHTNPDKGNAVGGLDSGSVLESFVNINLQDINPISPSRSATQNQQNINTTYTFSRRINVWTSSKGRSISKDILKRVLVGFGFVDAYIYNHSWCVILATSEAVLSLLHACRRDYSIAYCYFGWLHIFPWYLDYNSFMKQPTQYADVKLSVCVKNIPLAATAKCLAEIMDKHFCDLVGVEMNTDGYSFPIGSAVVFFSSLKGFLDVVTAGRIIVTINTINRLKSTIMRFTPNYKSNKCGKCAIQYCPIFCYHSSCCMYYCKRCWIQHHASGSNHNHPYFD